MGAYCEDAAAVAESGTETVRNADVSEVRAEATGFVRGRALMGALRGVPKPALESVLGKRLGEKVWAQVREADAGIKLTGVPSSGIRQEAAGCDISDKEILDGLLGHLSRQAGRTLCENGRLAKAIGLIVSYSDGAVVSGRLPTMIATSDEREILDTAVEILAKLPERLEFIDTIELTVSSVEAETARQPSFTVNFGMAGTEFAHA